MKFFGRRPLQLTAEQAERDRNARAVAAIVDRVEETRVAADAVGDERTQPEYEAFRETFLHPSGVLFVEWLQQQNAFKMLQWLEPRTPEAEPKAFVRLVLAAQQRGENFWDQPGMTILLEGRWSQGGGPSDFSDQALSVLSQMLAMPIKLYYKTHPGSDSPLLVKEYRP